MRKVLIANRGEIAVRVIRSCRELGIRTVAVYSDADREMPHVLAADEAFRIGSPPSRESYLVMDRILDIARQSGADAIHPGYGFLSENAEFSSRVREAGFIFIGPRPESIRAMGDKVEARRLMRSAGVPVVPGTDGPIAEESAARVFADKHGYPVLLKAAAGGGGKGMRIVRGPEELSGAFRAARSEARSAFGDDRVYVEKYLDQPRHIEFQIFADRFGATIHCGERECSIQRRHQKVVEETPSTVLNDDLRRRMGETAVRAAQACGYENAGTIEFLVDAQKNFYFLEMNTRLQVEHPITELRTGLDLVALQIAVADGKPLGLRQEDVRFRGHAIECRICAEDPENAYMPSTGKITHLRPSMGIGIREDRGIDVGGEVSVYYDPMISKLVAWGQTRDEAIHRMLRALNEYEILGVTTNIPLCAFVLSHPRFATGDYDTHFLSQEFQAGQLRMDNELSRNAAAILCAFLEEHTAGSSVEPINDADAQTTAKGWTLLRLEAMRR
jgi:acetyl-CoA carboxylase, biotin carboxylase subunit